MNDEIWLAVSSFRRGLFPPRRDRKGDATDLSWPWTLRRGIGMYSEDNDMYYMSYHITLPPPDKI